MTAHTQYAGAVRPTVAPPAPESPAAAHWNAYAAAHGPALRARSRRAALHTMLGLFAVAAALVAIMAGFALLSPAEQHLFAGAGILAVLGAFVAVCIWSTRRAQGYHAPPPTVYAPPPQPPAQLPGPVTIVFDNADGRRATMQFADPDAARRFLAEGRR